MLTLARGKNVHVEIDSGSMPRNSAFHLGLHSLSALSFSLMKASLKHTCTRVILSLSLIAHTHTRTRAHAHTWKNKNKRRAGDAGTFLAL